MNILIIVTKGEVGGAQTSVLNLARSFHEKGHAVTVGFGKGDFLKKSLEKEGIPYVRFTHLKRTHNPLENLRYILELRKYISQHGCEVVHFNSSNALFGALGLQGLRKKGALTVVFTFRGMSFLDPHYESSWYVRWLYIHLFRFFMHFIDHPVFVSNDNREQAKHIGLLQSGSVIYNGIHPHDTGFFSKDEAREKLAKKIERQSSRTKISPAFDVLDPKIFLIGSIGRLAYQKNYEFLIDIFPEILKIKPEARLIITGDGPERERYVERIKSLGLEDKIQIIYHARETARASRYLCAYDLFVLPSRYEGMPITLLETLFAGSIVLATDVGGNREVLNGSNEQLYALDNKKEFVEKITRLMQDVELRKKIHNQNLTRAHEFEISKTAEQYARLYRGEVGLVGTDAACASKNF